MAVTGFVSNFSSSNSVVSCDIGSFIGGTRVLASSIDNFKERDRQGTFEEVMLLDEGSPQQQTQEEEDNGLWGSTLNNVNDLFDAVDAKVRQFVLRGWTSLLVGFFHEN
jgi:hypothetical protein